MELHEMRYFLALSRTLNFTKASEECHVSQPALTRAIRKMENELGGLLFHPERNNTHFTELGRLIEPHLTEILAQTIAAGLGVCMLPAYTAAFPGIVGCPIVAPSVSRSVCVVTVAHRPRSGPLSTFSRAIRQNFEPLMRRGLSADDRVQP